MDEKKNNHASNNHAAHAMAEKEKSFADFFESDTSATVNFEPGQKIKTTIVRIGNEWVFLDLGAKSEGRLAKGELADADGNLKYKEGDAIEAFFLADRGNGQLFTTKLGTGITEHAHIEEAFHNGIPVEGVISKEIKGGFEVVIAGKTRGFCPYSQTGARRDEDTSQWIGKSLAFMIIEYRDNGRSIIFSHKKILEEERQRQKETLRETLRTGMTVPGIITGIREFGAFVDIGGIEGLIPVSEISWGRTEDINRSVAVGQKVTIEILKLDWEGDRYSFSLKNTLPDPWDDIDQKYPEGSCHQGKIARLTQFGAFVTLEEGIDGLLHISNLGGGRRLKHPREAVKENELVEVRIDKINKKEKRLSLALASVDQENASQDHSPASTGKEVDEQAEYRHYLGKPSDHKSFGTLGDLLKKKSNYKK